MTDSINYFEPYELDFFCRAKRLPDDKSTMAGYCRFPQNVRSKSYQRMSSFSCNKLYFHVNYATKIDSFAPYRTVPELKS